jgi:hypothetical protein
MRSVLARQDRVSPTARDCFVEATIFIGRIVLWAEDRRLQGDFMRSIRPVLAVAGLVIGSAVIAPMVWAAPLRCQGIEATIVGTGARDDLTGTRGRDVIVGLGGWDRIDGLGGDDVVCGGTGTD